MGFLSVALIIMGCHQQPASKLHILDGFVESNPDSTYSVLLTMKKDAYEFKTKDRMYYGLLCLKCQNILGLPFDAIDDISSIVDYHTTYGTYNEALLATYLLGRSYVENGDEPMAVEYFNKCLSLKAKDNENVNYIQLSKVHSQLDYIYCNQNLPQFELKELKAAERCALMGEDTLLALNYECLMANPYHKLGLHDSVLHIVNSVREKYLSRGMKDKAAEALYLSINAYIEKMELIHAKRSIDIYERESGLFDNKGYITDGREIYYYLKSEYFEAIGKMDSVEFYCRRLLAYDSDINNLEAAYKGLLSVYRSKMNSDSIGKYADLYCEANDSVHSQLQSENISKLKAMYDYSTYKEKAEDMKRESEETKRRSIQAISIVTFLLLFLAVIGIVYKRRKTREINKLLEEYDRTLQVIDELQDDREELLRKHVLELESINLSLQNRGVNLNIEEHENKVSEEALAKFRDLCDNVKLSCSYITAQDWQQLFYEMSNCDSRFMVLLIESNLSENERKIAILLRLHFTDYQIKRIINSYGSALPNYKARINKKLFRQSSARTLRRLIYGWK